MGVKLQSSSGGSVEIAAPVTASNYVLTAPATSSTIDTLARTGNVLQVVSAIKTDIWARSTSNTDWADVTGMSLSITPSSINSKVLVFVDVKAGMNSQVENRIKFRVLRNTTAIGGEAICYHYQNMDGYQDRRLLQVTLIMQDSPASTSEITYKVQHANSNAVSATTYVNRSGDGAITNAASSITLMEIAG